MFVVVGHCTFWQAHLEEYGPFLLRGGRTFVGFVMVSVSSCALLTDISPVFTIL